MIEWKDAYHRGNVAVGVHVNPGANVFGINGQDDHIVYMLWSFGFFKLFQVYSIDSSKMLGNFPKVLNFIWLFFELKWFIRNYTKYDI